MESILRLVGGLIVVGLGLLLLTGELCRRDFPEIWIFWLPLLVFGSLAIVVPLLSAGRARRKV